MGMACLMGWGFMPEINRSLEHVGIGFAAF